MIIVKLVGGLGNQMFQYAIGRKLSIINNTTLKLDINSYTHSQEPLRIYGLNVFNIREDFANTENISTVKGENKKGLEGKIFNYWQSRLPYYKKRIIKQKGLLFDPNVNKSGKNVYLDGYWQSEKYFLDIENIIRQDFVVKTAPNKVNQELLNEITNVNSICIHVRRGDYVNNPHTNQVHGVCSLEYYTKCIDFIVNRVDNPCFFIFSDDPDWVQNNLKISHPVVFVAHNKGKDYEDLRLMYHCKHFIIANSSFSWWGAWLSNNPKKIVCAPKRWFNKEDHNKNDIVPENWFRF